MTGGKVLSWELGDLDCASASGIIVDMNENINMMIDSISEISNRYCSVRILMSPSSYLYLII